MPRYLDCLAFGIFKWFKVKVGLLNVVMLAYDNWRCSIQPEIFHSLKVPSSSRDLISD